MSFLTFQGVELREKGKRRNKKGWKGRKMEEEAKKEEKEAEKRGKEEKSFLFISSTRETQGSAERSHSYFSNNIIMLCR